jgi:hypothetical protein
MSASRLDDASNNGEGEMRPDGGLSSATEPHTSDPGNRKLSPGRSWPERASLLLSVFAVVIAAMSACFTWWQAVEVGKQADAAQYANDLADSATARKIRVEKAGDLDNALVVDNQSDQRAESMWLEGRNDVANITINLYDLAPCRRLSSNATSTIGVFLKSQGYMSWTVHFTENGRRWERDEGQLPKRVDEKTIIGTTFTRYNGLDEAAIPGCTP